MHFLFNWAKKCVGYAGMATPRITKLVCTLGPATESEKQIETAARAGMDVARLNLSHGTWADHLGRIKTLQKINARLVADKKFRHPIGILLDTQGPEIRTSVVETPIVIKEGEEVVFSSEPRPNEKRQVILVNHKLFAKDVKQSDTIILDNGKIIFESIKVEKDGRVLATARESGTISSKRHVNLPGADLSMPSLTEKDWHDITAGAKEGVDFVALSFIRRASEVEELRTYLKKKKLSMKLISKIETKQSVENLEEIVAASDGIMVARGDLGSELPFEKIPVIQDRLVAMCREAGKPVIVATHMLESMIDSPMPTRAEVTDIAHAAMTGTDSTMLSGETAGGKFPLLCIDAMRRVLKETERHLHSTQKMQQPSIRNPRDARAEAAVKLAISSDADIILVMTKSGQTAIEVSRFRPSIPVIAFTPNESVQRVLQLSYNTLPVHIPFDNVDPEKTVQRAVAVAREMGLLKAGHQCVIVSDARAHNHNVGTVQIRSVS